MDLLPPEINLNILKYLKRYTRWFEYFFLVNNEFISSWNYFKKHNNQNVSKIQFSVIGLRRHYTNCYDSITFNKPVTPYTALTAVEHYFTQPLTDEHYEKFIKPYKPSYSPPCIKGDFITGNYRFITDFNINPDGLMTFTCEVYK
jgi:hypothetical protein